VKNLGRHLYKLKCRCANQVGERVQKFLWMWKAGRTGNIYIYIYICIIVYNNLSYNMSFSKVSTRTDHKDPEGE
jgi:hypothetical protein